MCGESSNSGNVVIAFFTPNITIKLKAFALLFNRARAGRMGPAS